MIFKKYEEFINESLVILSMKGLMKNEFMNNNILRQDFETARRIMYERTSSIFSHIQENKFSARTLKSLTSDDMDSAISIVNEQTKRMKFSIFGKPKKTEMKETVWEIKCELA
jgi:hypothetical protein